MARMELPHSEFLRIIAIRGGNTLFVLSVEVASESDHHQARGQNETTEHWTIRN